MEDNDGLPFRDRFSMTETLFAQALGLIAARQVDEAIFEPQSGRIASRCDLALPAIPVRPVG
jgi:hypothetical protein